MPRDFGFITWLERQVADGLPQFPMDRQLPCGVSAVLTIPTMTDHFFASGDSGAPHRLHSHSDHQESQTGDRVTTGRMTDQEI